MTGFIDYVRDQLQRLGPYSARAMFGGHGLFWQGTMFALVVGDTIHLRTDARNRPDYEKLGLTPHHALAFPGFVRKPAKPRRGGKAQAPAARVRRLRGTAG